jgi:hypothetical protein
VSRDVILDATRDEPMPASVYRAALVIALEEFWLPSDFRQCVSASQILPKEMA